MTLVAVVLVFFMTAHVLSVPLVREFVQRSEENAGRNILDTVYQIVTNTKNELDNFHDATIMSRKKELKSVIQLIESGMRTNLELRLHAGKKQESALHEIFEEIRHYSYGDHDYVWVMDYDMKLVSHPDSRLHQHDARDLMDVKGNMVLVPLLESARKNGDGYHRYWWRRLGQETPIEKLSYCKDLPDLGYLLCTGFYIDDIKQAVELRRQKIMANLKVELGNIHLAKGGYIFIFDKDLNMLVHPNSNLEGKNLANMVDPKTGEILADRLRKSANQSQGLRYRWDRPSDPGNYTYDKLAWVRHFGGFDWYLATSVYLDDLYEGSETLSKRLFWIAMGGLILAMLLGFLFMRRLTSPLEVLSVTAQRVRQGDLTARCPVMRQDEIGQVANAFNAMVNTLQEYIQGLDDKVRSRTAELEKANADLRELDHLKSEFLSCVSHELRTPLTAIFGFSKLLQSRLDKMAGLVKEDRVKRELSRASENVSTLITEGTRLTRLVDQVMDLTNLEAHRVTMAAKPVNMLQLLALATEKVRPRADNAGLGLNLVVPGELPLVNGDATRLMQVIDHLLDNSIKFTQVGQITVSAALREQALEISVRDTGIGVPEQLRDKIFDRFHQGGEVLTEKPAGIGLGLPISRLIVEQHGGTIGMEPVPGGGSRFFFSLSTIG
ncbi:MAG: cache domain-containing protein [Magnetococcus sp. DMHC-1]|nr:cache domain-containing protein [Magnetococcales bacterium]